MDLATTVFEVQQLVTEARSLGKTIGLVPTMGALHSGHLSLVEQCLKENDACVVSIFVNPTQFNNQEDLQKYPRTLERDCKYLSAAGATCVFAPSVQEVYPVADTRVFEFGQLDKVMEGMHRPGHFNGVAQVVSRLFDIVKPDKAYFGEKDFQQLAIIRAMVKQLQLPVQIESMPIIRESNGLALSSRNERLTHKQKDTAVNISRVLFKSREWMNTETVQSVINRTIAELEQFEDMKAEYFEIVDGYSLQAVQNFEDSDYIVGCIAIYCGEVRLIDNIVYKQKLK